MDYREINRQALLQESKEGLINKCPNLDDEQKKNLIVFFQKHPQGYDKMVDWNRIKSLTWEDFQPVLDAAENNTRNKHARAMKAAAEGDLTQLFSRPDVAIMGENDEWIYVSPLSHEACVWMDSAECGGGGARWCIGTKDNDSYWMNYLKMGNSFIMAFRKDFKDHDKDNDIKYMIKYNVICEDDDDPCFDSIQSAIGDVWDQVETRNHPVYEFFVERDEDSPYGISQYEVREYAHEFWTKLFEYDPDMANETISEQSGYAGIDYAIDDRGNDDFIENFNAADIEEGLAIKDFGEETWDAYTKYNTNWETEIHVYSADLMSSWDVAANLNATLGDVVNDFRKYYQNFYGLNKQALENECRDDYEYHLKPLINEWLNDNKIKADLNLPTKSPFISGAVVGRMDMSTFARKAQQVPASTDFVSDVTVKDGMIEVIYADDTGAYILDFMKMRQFFDDIYNAHLGIRFNRPTYLTNLPSGEDLVEIPSVDGVYNCNVKSLYYYGNMTKFDIASSNVESLVFDRGIDFVDIHDSTVGSVNCSIRCVQLFSGTLGSIPEYDAIEMLGAIGNSHVGKDILVSSKMLFTKSVAKDLAAEGMRFPQDISIVDENGKNRQACRYENGKFIATWDNKEIPLSESLKRFLRDMFRGI